MGRSETEVEFVAKFEDGVCSRLADLNEDSKAIIDPSMPSDPFKVKAEPADESTSAAGAEASIGVASMGVDELVKNIRPTNHPEVSFPDTSGALRAVSAQTGESVGTDVDMGTPAVDEGPDGGPEVSETVTAPAGLPVGSETGAGDSAEGSPKDSSGKGPESSPTDVDSISLPDFGDDVESGAGGDSDESFPQAEYP